MDSSSAMPPISLPPIDNTGDKVDDVAKDHQEHPAMVSAEPMAVEPVATTPQTVTAPSLATPSIADDVDLIEKEWVKKVKEIKDKTKNDPYEQSKQLSVLKADYLHKRYSINIKLS